MRPLPQSLADTDTLSAMMRREPVVIGQAQEYLREHGRLSLSLMSRYEILRGLEAKGAPAQLCAFNAFCAVSEVLPLTDAIVVRAARIYADLRGRGEPIGDADILIAATALEHGLAVATNNRRHFGRIRELQIENWLE